jgi:hypothetical protein
VWIGARGPRTKVRGGAGVVRNAAAVEADDAGASADGLYGYGAAPVGAGWRHAGRGAHCAARRLIDTGPPARKAQSDRKNKSGAAAQRRRRPASAIRHGYQQ